MKRNLFFYHHELLPKNILSTTDVYIFIGACVISLVFWVPCDKVRGQTYS